MIKIGEESRESRTHLVSAKIAITLPEDTKDPVAIYVRAARQGTLADDDIKVISFLHIAEARRLHEILGLYLANKYSAEEAARLDSESREIINAGMAATTAMDGSAWSRVMRQCKRIADAIFYPKIRKVFWS